jgi:hypothetical protein
VTLALALVVVYLLISPVAAILSAVFPRAVDLNSVGRGSNAHGLAGLLGMIAFAASAAPCVFLYMFAARFLHNAALAPALLLVYAVIAVGVNRALFVVARRLFAARRENLALIALHKTS